MMLNKMRTSNQKTKFYRVLRILDGVMGALLKSYAQFTHENEAFGTEHFPDVR
jgi:hypothetical protein